MFSCFTEPRRRVDEDALSPPLVGGNGARSLGWAFPSLQGRTAEIYSLGMSDSQKYTEFLVTRNTIPSRAASLARTSIPGRLAWLQGS